MTAGSVATKSDLQRVAQQSLELNRAEFNTLLERARSLAAVDDTIFVALAERAELLEGAELAALIEGASVHNVSLGVFIAAVLAFADEPPVESNLSRDSLKEDPTISLWDNRSGETLDWAARKLEKIASTIEEAVTDRRKRLSEMGEAERRIDRTQAQITRRLNGLTQEVQT